MSGLTRFTNGIPPLTILATFGLGGAGGLLASWLGLPLAMLLGSMTAVTLASALGLRVGGHALAVPQKWRYVLVPIVGTAIGASFPPDFASQALHWWLTMAALVVFIPAVHALGYLLFGRLGGLSRPTAYYAAMPGGFIESLDMGEKAGADMPMLIMLQLLRLILCIVLIPIAFSLIEGQAVGSASGLAAGAGHAPLTLWDAAVLTAIAVSGWFIASRLNFPAAVLSGPLLLSGLAHALGLTAAVPPVWMVLVTQWVMGTSLAVRLSGFTRGEAGLALRLSLAHVGLMLGVALGVALLTSGPVGEPISAVVLAFAPGGVTEMSLVALSLHLSAVYVTLHHLARIVLAVLVARIGQRWVGL
ncbi:AbrB family transcriptional regulator [Pararhodobacter sp.]|uniref:AbrB family transcriptional regulator n=1 Tax=Pararhodobacter TaxID=1097465 RepID=UPI002AFDEDC7|nr:AbrB family transcriptional regulator [Pararhodobacter sp.]